MAKSQARSRRKATGGRYKDYRKKKSYELGGIPVLTRISERRVKKVRVMGGNRKLKLLNVDFVNAYDKKSKKYEKVKIKSVLENSANRHFVRMNIITKGCVVDTEKGKVKINSRPGQESSLSGVFLEKEVVKK